MAQSPVSRSTIPTSKYGVVACLSPDGRYFATAGNFLHLWETDTGNLYCEQRGPITGFVLISPDLKRVAAQVRWDAIRVWQVPGSPDDIPPDYDGWTAALAPDGNIIATAQTACDGAPGAIKVRDIVSGSVIATFPDMEPWPNDLFFSPDGRYLAFAFKPVGSRIALLDWKTKEWKTSEGPVVDDGIAFCPDGSTIAVGVSEGVALWDTASLQRRAHYPVPGNLCAKAFSQDGRYLAVSYKRGSEVTKSDPGYWLSFGDAHTVVLDVKTGKEVALLPFSPYLAFRSDGTLVSYSAEQAAILIWDIPPAFRLYPNVFVPPLLVAALFTMCAWLAGRIGRRTSVRALPEVS